ncbi:hypothetical protein ACWGNA_26185 [Brucella cytisi]|uniref:hypothetical protein n=1 Tax=Brucella cytisi TaxID=407152 RepID=UPI0035DF2549
MTSAEIMAVVGFIVMLMGFLFGLWKYVESHISKSEARNAAKAEAATTLASLTRQGLSDYKLRVAGTPCNEGRHAGAGAPDHASNRKRRAPHRRGHEAD